MTPSLKPFRKRPPHSVLSPQLGPAKPQIRTTTRPGHSTERFAWNYHRRKLDRASLVSLTPSTGLHPTRRAARGVPDAQSTLGLSQAVFVQASCHGSDNRVMVDALRWGQGRYAGVAMIEDASSDH